MKLTNIKIHSNINNSIITSSFLFHKKMNTSQIMLWVIIATIPGIIAQVYFFSIGVLYQIILGISTALICEVIVFKLRKFPILIRLKDNSALLTGILLAISIPPLSPWWIIVIGTTFAILIAKHSYGGLGQNPFNPAMVGYIILLISFPIQMTHWLPPVEYQNIHINYIDTLQLILFDNPNTGDTLYQLKFNIDSISQPTPLNVLKNGMLTKDIQLILQQPMFQHLFIGNSWQIINFVYLLSGIILTYFKIICWQIPIGFLSGLFICSLISWMIVPTQYISPLIHLFSGATMFGAFFIATDPVTATSTSYGRIIYGFIIGILIWIIRVYGGYPDAIAFSVLLGNLTVPLIDIFTKPNIYGNK